MPIFGSTSGGGSAGPLNNFAATRAPTVTDDASAGYTAGANPSRWFRPDRNLEWVLTDASVGAAVWQPTSLSAARLARMGTCIIMPMRNAGQGTGTLQGIGGLMSSGQAYAQAPDNTSAYKRQSRQACFTSATAGSTCYWRRDTGTTATRRDIGFTAEFWFGIADGAAVANARMFVGHSTNANPGGANVDPSTLTGSLGVGCDAGDASFSFFENDGSGAAVKTPVGTGSLGNTVAPATTLSTDLYKYSVYQAPGGSSPPVMSLTRVFTGEVWTHTAGTDVPAASTPMCAQLWRNNGTTALSVQLDFFGYWEEQPWQ